MSEILTIEGNKIRVTGLDALNGKPILDIKSCEEHFDSPMGLKGIRGTCLTMYSQERLEHLRPTSVVPWLWIKTIVL